MIIKLTYYGTNRVTLVNLNNVESIYELFDKVQRRMSTKIQFRGNDSYVNVEEDLKTIMKLYYDGLDGVRQEINWENQTFDNTMIESFDNQYNTQYQRRPRRQRIYNENQY